MLDGEKLKKYLSVTIINEKILIHFIILLEMIDREGSFVAHLIN